MNKQPYVSCIKVNGTPILPPLITPALRKQVLNYKQQAIKLEQRLKQCRELKQNLDDLIYLKNSETPCSQITFGDISHIDALNIDENKKITLTKEIIEISQYNDHGMQSISASTNLELKPIEKSNNDCDNVYYKGYDSGAINNNDKCAIDQTMILTTPSGIISSPSATITISSSPCSLSSSSSSASTAISTPIPRLIRSNSYTLVYPSNVLLNYMQNLPIVEDDSRTTHFPPDKNNTEVLSKQTETNNNISQPVIQQEQSRNDELVHLLKTVPKEVAGQIEALFKKQQLENLTLSENESCKSFNLSTEVCDTTTTTSTIDKIENLPAEAINCTFLCSNRNSTVSEDYSSSIKLIDLEEESLPDQVLNVTRDILNKTVDNVKKDCPLVTNYQNNDTNLLPSNIDDVTRNYLRMDWAATVIGAHIKGYLTRRLFKTEKIQTIVSTVKDVLICAVELHQSEIIDEKDIELHRRLISQLSAALYAFHEIFFELSIVEQMSIISLDRERKKEKLKKSFEINSKLQSKKSVKLSKSFNRKVSSKSSNKENLSTINLTKT